MSYNERTIADDLKAIQQSAAGQMLNNFLKGLKQPAMVEMTPAQKLLYERRFGKAPQPAAPVTETSKAPAPSKSVTNAFGTQYDMSDPAQVAALNREIEEHKRGRLQAIDQKIAESKIKPDAPVPPTAPIAPTTGLAKLDPNATEEYKTAFKAGENKMDDMLKYFGSQNNGENLQKWAKANPALAYKEFKKAGMAGKEPFGYDEVEFGKLKENPAEAAEKLGIKIYDGQVEQTDQQKAAQAFKNTMTEITKGLDLSKYNDLGYNPFQIDPGTLLEKSVDFNVPGLEGTLGNYGTADYGELLKKYSNIFSNK